MKFMQVVAIAMLLSVGMLSAKFIVRINDEEKFVQMAAGKTVIQKIPMGIPSNAGGYSCIYITSGDDFYYFYPYQMYKDSLGLYLPTSTVIKTEQMITEGKWQL